MAWFIGIQDAKRPAGSYVVFQTKRKVTKLNFSQFEKVIGPFKKEHQARGYIKEQFSGNPGGDLVSDTSRIQRGRASFRDPCECSCEGCSQGECSECTECQDPSCPCDRELGNPRKKRQETLCDQCHHLHSRHRPMSTGFRECWTAGCGCRRCQCPQCRPAENPRGRRFPGIPKYYLRETRKAKSTNASGCSCDCLPCLEDDCSNCACKVCHSENCLCKKPGGRLARKNPCCLPLMLAGANPPAEYSVYFILVEKGYPQWRKSPVAFDVIDDAIDYAYRGLAQGSLATKVKDKQGKVVWQKRKEDVRDNPGAGFHQMRERALRTLARREERKGRPLSAQQLDALAESEQRNKEKSLDMGLNPPSYRIDVLNTLGMWIKGPEYSSFVEAEEAVDGYLIDPDVRAVRVIDRSGQVADYREKGQNPLPIARMPGAAKMLLGAVNPKRRPYRLHSGGAFCPHCGTSTGKCQASISNRGPCCCLQCSKRIAKVIKRRIGHNPPQAELEEIYSDILAIEAKKGKDSLWPGEPFRHDFNKRGSKILGVTNPGLVKLKAGDLVVAGKGRLWRRFNY